MGTRLFFFFEAGCLLFKALRVRFPTALSLDWTCSFSVCFGRLTVVRFSRFSFGTTRLPGCVVTALHSVQRETTLLRLLRNARRLLRILVEDVHVSVPQSLQIKGLEDVVICSFPSVASLCPMCRDIVGADLSRALDAHHKCNHFVFGASDSPSMFGVVVTGIFAV